MSRPSSIGSLAALFLAPGASANAGSLPDTFLARIEALASMQTLNAEILASRSATTTLDAWCARQGLGGAIRAERVHGPDKPPRQDIRQHLAVGPDETIAYRRVRLTCGAHVVSEADNWYIPARLSPDMNRLLETTDTPYGKVVANLKPTRRTLGAEVLWEVLPSDWATHPPPPDHPDETLDVPLILFEHHAIVVDAENRPLAEVEEHYTRDILPFYR